MRKIRSDKRKKNITIIKKYSLSILILVATLSMSVGYAAINSITMDINGELAAAAQDNVFITKVEYKNSVNAYEELSEVMDFYQTMLHSNIQLEDASNSSITYSVTVYNKNNYAVNFVQTKYDPAFYSNTGIIFTLNGLQFDDILAAKSYYTFDITFSFPNGVVPNDTSLNSYLNFEFKRKVSVTYENITGSASMPSYSYVGDAFSVTLQSIPTYLEVVMGGEIIREDYTLNGMVLGIPEVTGNIKISNINQLNRIVMIHNPVFTAECPILSDKYPGYYEIINDEARPMFCESIDSYGTTTYFRGNVQNNYVSFANKLWRIMRINGNGTVRMILDESAGSSKFNSTSNHNAYAGYMYGSTSGTTYSQVHANTNSSTLKQTIDTWYTNNLAAYSSYLGEAYFVNDRKVNDGVIGDYSSFISGMAHYTGGGTLDWGEDTATGIGTNTTYYGPWYRLVENVERNRDASTALGRPVENALTYATFLCTKKEDCFTTRADTTVGNGALTNPIATVSMDDLVMAGVTYSDIETTQETYLNSTITPTSFWTMSPGAKPNNRALAGCAYIVTGWSSCGGSVTTARTYRPVINLKGNSVVSSGNGTLSNPYVIQ